MKHDRFSLVLKFFHLADNNSYIPKGQPGHDPLFKIRSFLEPLIANFQECYTPHREDEAMVGFKERLSFIQYLPKKPTKWGMKSCVGRQLKWLCVELEALHWYCICNIIRTCMYVHSSICRVSVFTCIYVHKQHVHTYIHV